MMYYILMEDGVNAMEYDVWATSTEDAYSMAECDAAANGFYVPDTIITVERAN